ncbi:MAG: DUF4363 family protein [Ruminococcaceae bacterium]|nr:DUF4363 family protein [Oscillospiraceae bacterium]
MKAFIAGVVTLSVLITAVIANGFLVIGKTDRLLCEIAALPDEIEKADTSAIEKEWLSSEIWIALTVNRSTVDDIEDTLAQLICDIEAGNRIGYLVSRTKLECLFERLKQTETFNPKRIF